MGSISERLNALNEGRQLERETLELEERQLAEEKRKIRADESLMLVAKRDQYDKFQRLQQLGIIDMIADATGGLVVRADLPVSNDQQSVWDSINLQIKGRKGNDIVQLLQNPKVVETMSGQSWRYDFEGPVIEDNLTVTSNIVLDIVKSRSGFRFGNYDSGGRVDVSKVAVLFDGSELTIRGAEETYRGVAQQADTDVLEDAFVAAFDMPESVVSRRNTVSYLPNNPRF